MSESKTQEEAQVPQANARPATAAPAATAEDSVYTREELLADPEIGAGTISDSPTGPRASSVEEIAGALRLAVDRGDLPPTGPITLGQLHAALQTYRTLEV